MSNRIADAAKLALTATGFEATPGYCSRWVRQVVQSVTPAFTSCFGADANETGDLLKAAGYGVPFLDPKQAGDILVKFYSPHGHIGIYLGGGLVAENSTAHFDAEDHPDARGTRTMGNWGAAHLIARLPDMDVEPPLWRVLINGVIVARAIIRAGKAYVPVRRFEAALGCEVGWIEETKTLLIEGHAVPSPLLIVEGVGYIWARDLAQFHGLVLDTALPQTVRFGRE